MDVLIACECSQVVCKAFREKGHNAFSCDLQKSYGGKPEWHILGDCLPLLPGYCSFYTEDGSYHTLDKTWDLIIAHPPCTYLSKAGASRLFHYVDGVKLIDTERYKNLLAAREFFLTLIYLVPKSTKLCVENPIPLKIADLPKPSQHIEPYWFGDIYKKYTYLWLFNGLSELIPLSTVRKPGVIPLVNASSRYPGCFNSSKLRSQTSYFVARAMAEQWGNLTEKLYTKESEVEGE